MSVSQPPTEAPEPPGHLSGSPAGGASHLCRGPTTFPNRHYLDEAETTGIILELPPVTQLECFFYFHSCVFSPPTRLLLGAQCILGYVDVHTR